MLQLCEPGSHHGRGCGQDRKKGKCLRDLKITNSRESVQGQMPQLVAWRDSQGVWDELINRHGFTSPADQWQ